MMTYPNLEIIRQQNFRLLTVSSRTKETSLLVYFNNMNTFEHTSVYKYYMPDKS